MLRGGVVIAKREGEIGGDANLRLGASKRVPAVALGFGDLPRRPAPEGFELILQTFARGGDVGVERAETRLHRGDERRDGVPFHEPTVRHDVPVRHQRALRRVRRCFGAFGRTFGIDTVPGHHPNLRVRAPHVRHRVRARTGVDREERHRVGAEVGFGVVEFGGGGFRRRRRRPTVVHQHEVFGNVRVGRLGTHEGRVTVRVLVIRRGQSSKFGDGVGVVG